jgi:nucleoside-diphosphate-sugar epimerase
MLVAVTGAAGLVGCSIALKLITREWVTGILMLDVAQFSHPLIEVVKREAESAKKILIFKKLDLTTAAVQDIVDLLREQTISTKVLIHCASFGMSGADMLNKSKIWSVNVNGTQNMLKAASTVQKISGEPFFFVYVSSYNVCFAGNTLVNADVDKTPYLPAERQVDHYSLTKQVAEKLVLENSELSVLTCAVRPAAIYGEYEQRHFPRTRKLHQAMPFLKYLRFGSRSLLQDWVHSDNLAEVIVCAAEGLQTKPEKVNRQAFVASDDCPMNTFDFMAEILSLKPPIGIISIPVPLLILIAWIFELVYQILTSWLGLKIVPFLTRAEIFKVGITHYFSMHKTYQLLNYKPIWSAKQAMSRVRKHYSRQWRI